MSLIINANSLNTTNTTSALGSLTGITKTTDEEEETTAATEAAASTGRYDTVDFDEDAQQYLSGGTASVTETEEGEDADTTARLISETFTESEEDEDDSVDALYTYTESELAELLRNGDITQLEYDQELASRGIEE